MDGSTTLGTGGLNGSGVATFSTSALAMGSHSIIAVYGGDSNNNGSTSAVLTPTVQQGTTTVALTSSLNPSTVGGSITLTATAKDRTNNPITATAITFMDGSFALGSGTTNSSGAATFATSTLAAGLHSLTAVFAGNSNDSGSTSAVLAQTVQQIASTTALTSSLDPSMVGGSVTLTATVRDNSDNPVPAATVRFMDGLIGLGSVTTNSAGVAMFTISTLAPGQHSLTAVSTGNTNDSGSNSPVLTQTVQQNTAKDGNTALGAATLNAPGAPAFGIATLSSGSHSITAVYNGDASNLASASAPLSQTVNAADFTIAANPANASIVSGKSASFTLTVTPMGLFTGAIGFSCGSGLPAIASCAFQPASVTPNSGIATTTLTITTTGTGSASLIQAAPGGSRKTPAYALAASICLLPIAGALLLCGDLCSRRSLRKGLVAATAVLAIGSAIGCNRMCIQPVHGSVHGCAPGRVNSCGNEPGGSASQLGERREG
jgi:Bacterial Ig-like domain (group 3)